MHRPTLLRCVTVALAMAVLVAGLNDGAHPAAAVTPTTPTTTLSAPYTSATGVTYTFSGFTLAANQLCERVDVTFPAGTNLASAILDPALGTSAVVGNTVQCTFNPQIAKGAAVDFRILNVTNRATAANGLTCTLGFYVAKNWKGPFALEAPTLASGAFNVLPPYSMTISTNALNFTLEPEVTVTTQTVNITVNAGYPYTITRAVTGQSAEMGLQVSGNANGPGSAGTTNFVESVTADVPWTTAGGSSLTANISYTVLP